MTWIPLTYIYDTDVLALIIERVQLKLSETYNKSFSSYLSMPIVSLPYTV